MNQSEELMLEIQAMRDRLSRLTKATLSINESLDFETVLQGVLDNARELSNAHYGLITTVNESGRVEAFLTSGMTAEERDRVEAAPGMPQFFKYFSGLEHQMTVPDFRSHFDALGYDYSCPLAVKTFMVAPIRHEGRGVGFIHLGKRENSGSFTSEDEDTLAMITSQAALVITNARTYRDERRTRTDLETLIDTVPIGVAVIDIKTMRPESINRETMRIFKRLGRVEEPAERLLEQLTIGRPNKKETSIEDSPLAQMLAAGETLRAEEVVFQAPDGRSTTTLVNATPIKSKDGEVESVVVTLQDMTPLEELERLRTEFMAMVSHELRAPLTSIKGSAVTLMESAAELDPAESLQFHRLIVEQADHMRALISDLLDMTRVETGTLSVAPEPSDAGALVDRARNTFLSGEIIRNIDIDIEPDLPQVMADRRRIVQVLGNLLTNAAKHSPESSPVHVAGVWCESHVFFSISDNGTGVSADRLPHLFRKFSRVDGDDRVSGIAGSGLGLAICKGIVEAHGGRIWAESDGPGLGARFTFTLPVASGATNGASAPPVQPAINLGHTGQNQVRVLVLDDDPQALRYFRDVLSEAGYTPIVTGDPKDLDHLIREEKPHLVLLDLMLPGKDGIELMEGDPRLANVPVIFISGYGRDEIIARALEAGAADYVVKPFSPTELLARIKSALRKRPDVRWLEPSEPYTLQGLVIDYAERKVSLGGHRVRLTDTEYRLLFELSVNAGRVLTYDYLLQRVWGHDHLGDVRPMRTVMSNLRSKLGDDAEHPAYIFTEPRVGYRMPKGEGLGGAVTDALTGAPHGGVLATSKNGTL